MTPEPDDGGERIALRGAVIPGLTRDPANKDARCKRTSSHVAQAETLHPHGQALRPPGYFDGCPYERDAPPMFSSLSEGDPAEGCAPLGGFGLGVKGFTVP